MVLCTLEGYATHFEYNSRQWVHLSEEICFIELVLPSKIILYNSLRVYLLTIELQSSFFYQKQNATSVVVCTSSDGNSQTYGFGFVDVGIVNAFLDGLGRLKENKESLSSCFEKPMKNNFQQQNKVGSNNYETIEPAAFQSNTNGYQPLAPRAMGGLTNPFQTVQPTRNQHMANPFHTVQPRNQNILNPFQTTQTHSNNLYLNQLGGDQSHMMNMSNSIRITSPQDTGIGTLSQRNISKSYMQTSVNTVSSNTMPTVPQGIPIATYQNFMGSSYLANGDLQQTKETNNTFGCNITLDDYMSEHVGKEPEPVTEEENLCHLLSEAICEGNIDLAQEFVEKLAEKMTKITISRSKPRKSDFNILIQIEDKNESEGTIITESVDPLTTILKLKHQIFRKYNEFPVDQQMWIIGKSLAKDDQTLSDCGIKSTGTLIYLYLKSIDDVSVSEMSTSRDQEVQTEEEKTNFLQSMELRNTAQDYAQDNGFVYVDRNDNNQSLMAAPPPPVPPERIEGWECPDCTYKNLPTFEGCKICTAPRPADYNVPAQYQMTEEEVDRIESAKRNEELALQMEYQRKADEAMAAQENYHHILQAMDQKLLPNQEAFECSICYLEVEKGEGVMLRECLHNFCKECVVGTINASEDPEVHCPHNDGFACPAIITMQEIEELLPNADYEKYLARSVQAAERGAQDSFHCRSSNCIGWCFYEDDVNHFICPICRKNNCLTCKAIHPDQTCKEYQDDLKIRAENDEAAKKTQQMLEELITRGEAMNCPHCKVILQKKSGCDWMKCSMCRTEICWATKGPRWGPKGNGDTSAGCRCGINGRCTPNCGNCH